MGKILQTSLALMFTFMLAGLFMFGIESQSTDPNETPFVRYPPTHNQTPEYLTEGNVTYQDTDDLNDNFQRIAANMEAEIAKAQKGLSGSVVDVLASAFGLITSLTMNALFLLLAVIIQGVNMIGGITMNLMYLPAPWNILAGFMAFAVALLIVYLVFRIVNAYKGSEPA